MAATGGGGGVGATGGGVGAATGGGGGDTEVAELSDIGLVGWAGGCGTLLSSGCWFSVMRVTLLP